MCAGNGLSAWMVESSHVRRINVFLSHSLRLLLYWNPNKTDSLQWTEEDKFGFLSSFALFDASLTKRGYEYRKPSRLQFLSNVPYVDLAFSKKNGLFSVSDLFYERLPLFGGNPCAESKPGPDILYVRAVQQTAETKYFSCSNRTPTKQN